MNSLKINHSEVIADINKRKQRGDIAEAARRAGVQPAFVSNCIKPTAREFSEKVLDAMIAVIKEREVAQEARLRERLLALKK